MSHTNAAPSPTEGPPTSVEDRISDALIDAMSFYREGLRLAGVYAELNALLVTPLYVAANEDAHPGHPGVIAEKESGLELLYEVLQEAVEATDAIFTDDPKSAPERSLVDLEAAVVAFITAPVDL